MGLLDEVVAANAAREAVECVALIRVLAQLPEDLVIQYYGDDADEGLLTWNVINQAISDYAFSGKTLLAALRAADEATKQEKLDV